MLFEIASHFAPVLEMGLSLAVIGGFARICFGGN
jgi:hypothetical protein